MSKIKRKAYIAAATVFAMTPALLGVQAFANPTETVNESVSSYGNTSNVKQIIASLSIREKADPTSNRLGVVPRLSLATVTGKTEDKYSEITYNGMTGWVETRFVKDYEGELPDDKEEISPEIPEESNEAKTVQIIASLSIREKADSTSDKLGVISRLSLAKSTGNVEGKYSEITYNSITGWVETRFVKDYEGDISVPEDPNVPIEEDENIEDARRTVIASIGVFDSADAKNRINGITRNTNVTVTGKVSGKYSEISQDGLIGWVETRFVKEYNSEFDMIPDSDYNPSSKGSIAKLGKQEIRTDSAYVYEKTNAKSLVVDKISKYSVVEVLNINGAWAKVKLEDKKEGYIVVTHLGEYVADSYSNWKVGNKNVPVYDQMGPKGKKITSKAPNRPIELIENMNNGWSKIRVYSGTADRIHEAFVGYTYTSYLDKYDPEKIVESPTGGHYKPASEREQRRWTDSLPQICKDTSIAQIDIKNPEKTGAKYIFSTKVDSEGKNFFIITIDGNIDPFSETGQAIMKHECGHVLMTEYDQEYGRTAWRKFLDRGWDASNTNRVEHLADCVADELGATRGGVGYGTKCTPAQKQLAKELVDMYAPDFNKK